MLLVLRLLLLLDCPNVLLLLVVLLELGLIAVLRLLVTDAAVLLLLELGLIAVLRLLLTDAAVLLVLLLLVLLLLIVVSPQSVRQFFGGLTACHPK